jgi:hypothetical protein
MKCVKDENMRPLIYHMNTHYKGLTTISCCGGHKKPKGSQNKEGTFYVAFEGSLTAFSDFVKWVYTNLYKNFTDGNRWKKAFDRTKIYVIYNEDDGGLTYQFEGYNEDFEWMGD